MSETWKSRKDFLLLTEDDEAALQALRPIIVEHVGELVDAFYHHLLQFTETRRLLSDELLATRLKDAQKQYLLSSMTGPFDEAYQEGRLNISQVHERIGLAPEWYLGSYSLYLNLLRPIIFKEFQSRPAQLRSVMKALTKVLFLDIVLAIETSIKKSGEKLEFANRQLVDLGHYLEQGLTKAEHMLQKERDFISTFLETSGALVVQLDEEGRIVRVNRACEKVSGYARHEVNGRYLWDLFLLPEETEPVKALFNEVCDKRMLSGYATRWTTKDGARRCVAWNATCTTDDRGRTEYVIWTGIDLTDLKRTQDQLAQAARLAEIGTLASGMAHEIGTPMNVILGRAEYLMRHTQEETTRKGLETIVTQVERITKIMNQLLAFARRRPIDRQPVDLRLAIRDSLDMMKERLETHRIQVETVWDETRSLVHADADQMEQVLLNLILNAIDAMPKGGRLRVGLEQEQGQMKVTVADTGLGIPKDVLPRIFEPFFTTKEVGKGSGLGLIVVQGIVQEHEGSIRVESEPGRGTTVTITLPTAHPSPSG